ncbi:hypothetical protein [Kordiimonas laminariae]|uniref:hypothetical protein n=1 Tax=Kordiimonas laminariae TaxID=2917717 RepID=UPI001FF44AFC|nr:hypothetical protein [Kordiimonas laminariae]MCK0069818.1 hypothetical protein [Kordiimonas laminariae]
MEIQGLNRFELEPVGHYADKGMVFDMIIDGISYLETIKSYEAERGYEPAGAYVPTLGTVEIMCRSLNREFTMIPYGCDCGVWECWWLFCTARCYSKMVYIDSWSNPRRDDKSRDTEGFYWRYNSLKPVCVDIEEYDAAIKAAQSIIKEDASTLWMVEKYERERIL